VAELRVQIRSESKLEFQSPYLLIVMSNFQFLAHSRKVSSPILLMFGVFLDSDPD